MIVFAAMLVAMVVPVPAVQQPPPWEDWNLARPIVMRRAVNGSSTIAQTLLVRFAIPETLYGQARFDLADLRVIDSLGAQEPYAVDQYDSNPEVTRQDTVLSEQGFVPGRYSQAVADVGTTGAMHDMLTLETTADEFSAWVEISASDDERVWRIVRQRAPIFRFRSDGFDGSLDVRFARTRSRWLRLRVLDPAAPFPISGCSVSDVVAKAPELITVATDIRPDKKAPPKQTRLTVDLGMKGDPVSEVHFEVGNSAFHRAIAVLASEDGDHWNYVFNCEIYRDDLGGSSLSFGFPEKRGRFWRLIVYDRDDAPLQNLHATLLATPRYVTFRARVGGHYRLIFGNPHAIGPNYDFTASTSSDERARAKVATLGQFGVAMNPVAPVVPRPWTESHAGVVWAALVLAVVVLAWIALRAMR